MSDSLGPETREEETVRLANRAALLTLLSVCCFLLAAIVMPITFQSTEAVAARAIASTPIPIGVGAVMAARTARARWRAARDQEHAGGELASDGGTGAPGSEPARTSRPATASRDPAGRGRSRQT
jgi:hypothetical protein